MKTNKISRTFVVVRVKVRDQRDIKIGYFDSPYVYFGRLVLNVTVGRGYKIGR